MVSNNALILVGGTGFLGTKIAPGLAKAKGFQQYKAIVRNSAKAKPLAQAGWTLVEVDDYLDEFDLERAFAGAKTVVSAFGGADLVSLEKATIVAAKKAGATLFVPSQFGVDYRRWDNGHPFIASKHLVLQAAKDADLPTLSVFSGYFSDYTTASIVDIAHSKARIIGDGTANSSFTLTSDIGHVLAKALADPSLSGGGTLSIQGETLPWKEVVATLEAVTGKAYEREYIDGLAALDQEKLLLAKGLEGDIGSLVESFLLHLISAPARGAKGSDVSVEAKSYGLRLETLHETMQKMYGTTQKE